MVNRYVHRHRLVFPWHGAFTAVALKWQNYTEL